MCEKGLAKFSHATGLNNHNLNVNGRMENRIFNDFQFLKPLILQKMARFKFFFLYLLSKCSLTCDDFERHLLTIFNEKVVLVQQNPQFSSGDLCTYCWQD